MSSSPIESKSIVTDQISKSESFALNRKDKYIFIWLFTKAIGAGNV